MIHVELTERETRALHNVGALFASALEEQGCDPMDGDGPVALVSALMKLEVGLALAGESA